MNSDKGRRAWDGGRDDSRTVGAEKMAYLDSWKEVALCLLRFVSSVDVCFFFFFSSRRRHTRFDCDWSSDVCSSDLRAQFRRIAFQLTGHDTPVLSPVRVSLELVPFDQSPSLHPLRGGWLSRLVRRRSEERRVGKEC